MLLGEVYGTYKRSQTLRTRIRVRMAGNDITLRDVISEYAIEQIERNEDARNLVSMNRIPMMFLSHPKYGVKLLTYFRKDVCYVNIISLPTISRIS